MDKLEGSLRTFANKHHQHSGKCFTRAIVAAMLMTLFTLGEVGHSKDQVVEKSSRLQLFERLDTNKDQQLVAEEFFDGSVGKATDNKQREFDAWDLNQDGNLSFDEFKKRGNKAADTEVLNRAFPTRDANKDGFLTLPEFIGKRKGEEKTEAEKSFLRLDSNADGRLSKEEFVDRSSKKGLGPHNSFQTRDVDRNGKLDEKEFLAKVSQEWTESAKRSFARFDLNKDGFLSESEFALTPAQKPDPTTVFKGLDVDKNGELSQPELTISMAEKEAYWAKRSFAQYDSDYSEGLSLAEFLERDSHIQWKKSKRSAMSLLTTVFIVVDVGLVGLVGYVIYRRFSRRKSRPVAAPAAPPTSL